MYSFTIENYLKTIHQLCKSENKPIKTNEIAKYLKTKPSSVTDMLKKLSVLQLVNYTKYKGAELTELGEQYAVKIIRSHHLWEYFLIEKLKFGWDEVAELSEKLEHVKSEELINRLDVFLGHPSKTSLGEYIPNPLTVIPEIPLLNIFQMENETEGIISEILNKEVDFLKFLKKNGLHLHQKIFKICTHNFDQSIEIQVNDEKILLNKNTAEQILITENEQK